MRCCLRCYLYYSRHCGNFPDLFWKKQNSPAEAITSAGLLLNGAADEARTRYLHLGKVALYQMSYGRIKITENDSVIFVGCPSPT